MQLSVGIIKIEVSLPEAMRAIEDFRRNRIRAFEQLTVDVKTAVSGALDHLLQTEMTVFLGRPDQEKNKRNGFEEREYALKGVGCIRVRMPVDRKREFQSEIIRPREQIDPRLKEDMAVLHLAGLSKRTLSMVSRRILGVEVSPQTVTNSLDVIRERALKFLDRDLSDRKFWALFIDGTNFRIQRRSSTEKEPSLVVLGVDEKNHFSILAIEPGTKDNVDAWRAVFASLTRRGFDSSAVRIGVMDGLPGLEPLFKETYPKAVTGRCWVHALRNAIAKTPDRYREAFKTLAQRVMYASSVANAREAFTELKNVMGRDAERAVNCLEKDLPALLTHYQFDRPLWRALKTTNPIERVNKELKRRTKSMETLGERTLEVLVAFTALRLEYGWATTTVDMDRFSNLKSIQRINEIEQAMAALTN